MPWLMKEVTHELHEMVSSRDVLTGILKTKNNFEV